MYFLLLKVVSHYDLSVLSISLISDVFPKKVLIGVGGFDVGGWVG